MRAAARSRDMPGTWRASSCSMKRTDRLLNDSKHSLRRRYLSLKVVAVSILRRIKSYPYIVGVYIDVHIRKHKRICTGMCVYIYIEHFNGTWTLWARVFTRAGWV